MKKKLLMLLIGSMMLGMVGCANNNDNDSDSDKTTDSTKEKKPEVTIEQSDEPTEAPTENKKKITVEELLENVLSCEYNETVFTLEGSGKVLEGFGEIGAEFEGEIITFYDGDIEYEELEYNYMFDMVAFKEMLKITYEEEELPEDEWENYYATVLEMLEMEDGCMTDETKAYRYYEDGTWFLLEYDEYDDVWYKWDEEYTSIQQDLEIIVECCEDAELSVVDDGYILTATVVSDELMESLGLISDGQLVEIDIYFDVDAVFESFAITVYDIEDDDFAFDSITVKCVFSNDFDGELVLPTNIEEF